MFKGAPSAVKAGCSENQVQGLVVRVAELQRWLNKKPRLVTEAKFQALTGVLVAETFQ